MVPGVSDNRKMGGMDAIQYCAEEIPEPGETREMAPGVHWLRMPLPFRLDHINLWLLDDNDGWTIVDTGIADERTKGLWGRIFEAKLGPRPVRRLIVTHHHVDHIGLAGWLADLWNIPLSTSRVEWLYARALHLETSEAWLENRETFYRRAGMPSDIAHRLRELGNGYNKRVAPPPRTVQALDDGMTVRIGPHDWRVIIGTGHAPAQVCLHCPELRLLIAGDQVLPRISPNISVWPTEPEADPLADFLASLNHFRELPSDTLVLPSHGRPFTGLHARIDELVEHHKERLQQVLEICAEPASARDVQKGLFPRELDDHQMQFAVGEGLAHVNFLLSRGKIAAVTGANGERQYIRTTESGF